MSNTPDWTFNSCNQGLDLLSRRRIALSNEKEAIIGWGRSVTYTFEH